MLPEIKNFNFSTQFNALVKANDEEMLEEAWTIADLLSDDECIFRYDLADDVTIKSISCYLKQYWKAYWNAYDGNLMINAVILKSMKDDGMVKYAPQLPEKIYCDFYEEMFIDICKEQVKCPYAE